MSNAVRKQLGLGSDQLRVKTKKEHLPSHDLCVGQNVMFQDSINKRWFSATITSLCKEPRSYKITTKDGVTYRKTQVHLKPCRPQNKQYEAGHSIIKKCDKWTVKPANKVNTSDNVVQSKPKRNSKPPLIICIKFLILFEYVISEGSLPQNNYFSSMTSFCCLQVSFIRSNGKCSCH